MGLLCKWRVNSIKKKIEPLYKKRLESSATDIEIKKEIALHKKLIDIYKKKRFSKRFPHAAIYIREGYRVAANLNDAESQYELSKILFEKGRFWDDMKKSIYAAKIHDTYAKECYREAFAFLQAAEDQGHALAKRLHGQAYINGWGIQSDEDRGFKLIVASIEQEKAWDKATQIFEELGLNKPEFFSSIMDIKNKSK